MVVMVMRGSVEKMIRHEISLLTRQIERLQRRLHALNRSMEELEMAEYRSNAESISVRARTMGHNQLVIASILKDSKGPMKVSAIANRAFQTEQIKSAAGSRGVYSIVQTVLRRNSKTTFIKTAPATWDLRERHVKNNDEKLLIQRPIRKIYLASSTVKDAS